MIIFFSNSQRGHFSIQWRSKKENITDKRRRRRRTTNYTTDLFIIVVRSFIQLNFSPYYRFLFPFLVDQQTKSLMTDTEVALSGNTAGSSGDTEIDLYADVVENDLETV